MLTYFDFKKFPSVIKLTNLLIRRLSGISRDVYKMVPDTQSHKKRRKKKCLIKF